VDYKNEFSLTGQGIDESSETLETLLRQLDVERQNRLRIRFSIEEALLRLRDRFGEEKTFTLRLENRLGRSLLQVELEGEVCNPLSKTESALADWSGSLLTAVGLSPFYSYARGKNILRLSLPRKGMNAGLKMLIALIVGLLAGFLIHRFLPAAGRELLTGKFLTPLYEFWIRMLTACSGPVVFLMVCSSVLNSGTIAEEGGSTRRIIARYLLLSILAALAAVLASGMLSREPFYPGRTMGTYAADYFDAILQIMPENVITPLMQSNTPQILLLAFALGNSILIVGSRADGLKSLVRQGDMVGLLITEGVSRMAPYFAAALLCMEVIEDAMQTFWGLWRTLGAALLVSGAMVLAVLAYVALRKAVPVRLLAKKLWPSFLTVIRTGGIGDGYGQLERICVDRLGLETHFTSVSLPYGLVLYMPVSVIGTLLFTVFAAVSFGVEISAGWLLIAAVLSVVLSVATPPVPGATLLSYIMIFAQLGIPSAALIDAMIFDILFGVAATAANQTLLQLELVLQADKIGLLDKEKLRQGVRKSA